MSESSDFAVSEAAQAATSSEGLLPELLQHLRQNRTVLREEWARRINQARLLTALTPEEFFSEVTAVYDNYVEVLESGSVETLQAYARDLSERIIPEGVETDEVLGIVLLLRDVLARSLFEKYQNDFEMLNRVLDAYEPAANRIANTVVVSFVQARERIRRQQEEAMRELSTSTARAPSEAALPSSQPPERPTDALSTAVTTRAGNSVPGIVGSNPVGFLIVLAFVAFVFVYALAGAGAAAIAFWAVVLGLPALLVVVSALGAAWRSSRRAEAPEIASFVVQSTTPPSSPRRPTS
ncbi:anti-anti-sigma factor [Mycobacterium sp. SP-6446]|uniref:anti-anti-sigma factor n=1 Tax=Mycobacterium sp. SP-6446 TaxID=1834162 RepID=UPI0026DA0C44